MTTEEAIDHYYVKGQNDYPDWDPPVDELLSFIHIDDYDLAISKAYKLGFNHARSQAGD